MQIKQFLIIGTQKLRGKLDYFFPTPMLSQNFTLAVSARNLGVTFDNKFYFIQHISQTCRCCFYYIRDLHRMHFVVAKTIATALVSNSLYHNIALNDALKSCNFNVCIIVWQG